MDSARWTNWKIFLLIFVLLEGFLGMFYPNPVRATLESCSASVSPGSVATSITKYFDFSLNNTGSNPILYFKITVPSGNFRISGANIPGWGGTHSEGSAEFYSGNIPAGGTFNFSLQVQIGTSEAASANWTVAANDVLSGEGTTNCGGSLSTAISGVTDVTAPEISNVIITGIYATQATVTWNTNEGADSHIDYGVESDAFTLQKSSSTAVTSHSLLIDNLTANTTYYFFLTSSDPNGNTTTTDEVSFSTAAPDAGVATTVTVTVNTTTSTTNTVTNTVTKIIEVKDTVPPSLSLSTNFKKVYAVAPEITGLATDPSGVSLVEYTLDAGKNWLPVDNIAKRFAKSSAFSFLPGGLLDGNYPVKVRVTDAAGNVGFSSSYTLIIDRLPPRVGLAMWSVGPLVIEPTVLEGTKLKVSLSAVGGPTEIVLSAQDSALRTNLKKDEETGLWSGEVKFDKAGDYKVTVSSVDGADNKTNTDLGVVRVLPAGTLPVGGTLTVYYFEPTSGQFRIWDGSPFDQINPQKSDGKYELILPPGKYYLEAVAPGLKKTRTEIFTLDKTTPVNMNFKLQPKSWWPWEINEISWKPVVQLPQEQKIPDSLPFFALPSDTGELVYSSALRGVPTVVTFLSSWVPTVSEQVAVLDKLSQNKNYKVVAVFAQQPASLVEIFKKRGGYSLTMIADADGELLEPLGISSVPSHVFLDRKGWVMRVVKGLLNYDEIISNF